MSWFLLLAVVVASGLGLCAAILRRQELLAMQKAVRKLERVGSGGKQLMQPQVDLSRCLGCATCITACPEGDVLELVHGQARVVHGARCVGHAACERECPVGAITVTIANIAERDDIPVLSQGLESPSTPGLFLAGEVTAHALIKSAIEQGTRVASEVVRRVRGLPTVGGATLDLCIVGAGPAGLACALEAQRQGLRYVLLEQEEELGGTVAKYPRKKLVLTQPVELPMHGTLDRTAYEKEELMELWQHIVRRADLSLECGVRFLGCERGPDGVFEVRTSTQPRRARFVCLALGRRGAPNKLGVPGEGLPKVSYSLLDAHSYSHRSILVVGGGDSAVETALALAGQSTNRVTLSYRSEEFSRVRSRTVEKLEEARRAGRVNVLTKSELLAIHPGEVELALQSRNGGEHCRLPNDDVFVMVGGTTPIELLRSCGISFDRSQLPPPAAFVERGTGLLQALGGGFALSLLALVFAFWNSDYYFLESSERATHPLHDELRPGMGIGLWMGIASTACIAVNLAYLLRRSGRLSPRFGSLQAWMTSHVATGILAFLCATLHAAMDPRQTLGGHGWWALLVLLVTGGIGRYVYAWLPRAANGREIELEECRKRMQETLESLERAYPALAKAQRELLQATGELQWNTSFLGRFLALFREERRLRALAREIRRRGELEGVDHHSVRDMLRLSRRAQRLALVTAHIEDLRALLNSWRWLHRWVAALMVVLVALHVVHALVYGSPTRGGLQ